MEPSSTPWRVLDTPESHDSAPQPPADGSPNPGLRWLGLAGVLGALAVAGLAAAVAMSGEPVIAVDGAVDFGAGAAGAVAPSAPPASATTWLVVDVDGAVARPGVYRLAPGARVADAIAAAGGYGATVDATRADGQLNLAAPVADGSEIHVPVRGEPGAVGGEAGPGTDPAPGAGGPLVNLNTATAAELDTLPGVGPATAAKIIAAREAAPFASIDDLAARKAVGAATLEKLRALVTVGP